MTEPLNARTRLRALESRLALAAAAGSAAAVALRNFLSSLNSGGTIGAPSNAVSWNPGSITPKASGNILIIGNVTVQNANANQEITGQLLRNPTAATGANLAALGGTAIGPTVLAQAGAAGNHDAEITIAWIDQAQAIGSLVSYGISASAGAGNTIPINAAQLTFVELP